MTPEQVANLLRLVADLYGQIAAQQQQIQQQAARIADLEAERAEPPPAT